MTQISGKDITTHMTVEGDGMRIHALLCDVEPRDVLLVRFWEALILDEEGKLDDVPQVVVAIYAGVPELTVQLDQN